MLVNVARDQVRRLVGGRFALDVAITAGGVAAAHALSLAFLPILTRLYGPEAFGLLGSFVAITTVLLPLGGLAFPLALVLPRRDSEAADIAFLSMAIGFTTFLIGIVAATILYFMGATYLGAQRWLIFLIPVAVLLFSWSEVARYWLMRKGRFALTARALVANSVLTNTAKLFGWFVGPTGASLIGATTAGYGFQAMLFFWSAKIPLRRRRFFKRIGRAPHLFKRYRDFPLFRTPQLVLNAGSQSFPFLMLASMFGAPSAGYYTIAVTVIGAPIALIARAVSDVFYPKISRSVDEGGDAGGLIKRSTLGLAAIGLIPFGLAVAFGPQIFEFAFGVEWRRAGEYAQWLSLWYYCAFINRPSVAALPALGLQKFFLNFEILSTVVRLFALYLGFLVFRDDVVAVALFSVTSAILTVWLIWKAIRTAYRTRLAGAAPSAKDT